jgi:hypothetical protein
LTGTSLGNVSSAISETVPRSWKRLLDRVAFWTIADVSLLRLDGAYLNSSGKREQHR